MTLKEFVLSRVQMFFVLVTLILLGSAVYGKIFAPEQELFYYHLFSPIIIAGACILPTCVTYFKKEPTPRQYIIRQIVELLLIELVVMLLVSPPPKYNGSELKFYLSIGIMVGIIFIVILLLFMYIKYIQAVKLTEQLKILQATK